jgi:hypothetical protein
MASKVTYKGEQWLVIEHLHEYQCMALKHNERDEFLLGIKESEVEMTHELTYEQAEFLRAVAKFHIEATCLDASDWRPLLDAGLICDPSDWPDLHFALTDAGREALIECNRKFVTAPRDDIDYVMRCLKTRIDILEKRLVEHPIELAVVDDIRDTLNALMRVLEAK